MFALLTALLSQLPIAPSPRSELPYRHLTDTRRDFTNFAVETVRGFVVTPDATQLFALNTNQSTLLRFALPATQPTARWRTVNNPSSLAFDGPDLLVLGQTSHALARHDSTTGAITDLLALPSEPADLVVDTETHQAWVSCMGSDCVVQIDLTPPMSIVKRWNATDGLLAKRPRFLTLESGDPFDPTDDTVLVAPLISGNNTLLTTKLPEPSPLRDRVVDGYDATAFPAGGLPDTDLYRLRPSTSTVERIVRRAGSLILAHARNPLTHDYWLLSVDEHNLLATTEPALRGRFATNALSIVRAASWPMSSTPVLPDLHLDLDDDTPDDPNPTHSSATACSFPFALAFQASSGWAAIGSSTSPRIVLADTDGRRRFDLALDNAALNVHGRVVRTLRFVQGTRLYAYCQQTNNILVYSINPFATAPIAALDLGDDPAPAPVKRGRAIWYDASRSLDGRTSCNTCHPQGGSDELVWQLSNAPLDTKDPMVTQPLLGLEDSFPYHWRGERDLSDFNDAFPGLLGAAAPLNASELADFDEFVFSLVPHANPRQDVDRTLKDELVPEPQGTGIVPLPRVGSPIRGDALFHDVNSDGFFGNGSCASCHAGPTASNGDFFAAKPTLVASASNFEVIQLDTHLSMKDEPLVQVAVDPALGGGVSSFPSQLLGSGVLHDGRALSLFGFVFSVFSGSFNAQQKADLVAFLKLFDSGTAPGAHWVARLDASTDVASARTLRQRVELQSSRGWIGVIALSTWDVGGVPTPIAWMWDPASSSFVPEDLALATPQSFAAFVARARAGTAEIVLLGVPPGNERRFALDSDSDGLTTGEERAHGTDPWRADTDRDGAPDGDEVASGSNPLDPASLPSDTTPPQLVGGIEIGFVNASQVKLHFRSNEAARWSITLSTPGGNIVNDSRLTLERVHTAVVHRLEPSTAGFHTCTYSGTLVLTDRAGNASAPIPLPGFDSGSRAHEVTNATEGVDVVVGALALTNEQRAGTTWSARAELRVDWRELGPPAVSAPNQVVIAQLCRQASNGIDWEIVPAAEIAHDAPNAPSTSVLFDGQPYTALPGPFVVLAPTDANGRTQVNVSVANVPAGREVRFNVLAILRAPPGYNPAAPNFVAPEPRRYMLPATGKELRDATSSL